MEISKSLQEEIVAVQHKLQNAIIEHQICMNRLKHDPDNVDILSQIQKIQVYIISLGKCQKQVVQRLRKEVAAFKADNANGSKVSIPSLLGLNNNNHITNNNETKREAAADVFETKLSKEDYEEIVRNGDVHHSPPPPDNDCTKLRPSSAETISGEDDVVEVSMDENSDEKQEEVRKEHNTESDEKMNYLYCLGLITMSKSIELQNKRVERKRRSTANPHFVYSMLEQPSKRKRHSYLQSGNAPHTRQTTARMNGPSPPPNKTQPTKSTSPPAQALMPVYKSTTRPNILRNVDSKVFVNKSKIENNQARLSASSAKYDNLKNKFHIPGLPSSLTIERIRNDSIVCICCRNPGSLTVCKNCSSNYHVSCHTQSPAPPRICPQCALTMDEGEDVEKDKEAELKGDSKLPRYKKDEKLATTAHAPGAIGKAREDTEVNKAAGGFHKVDTTQKKCVLSATFGVNQLPASTFLIPIASSQNSAPNVEQSEDGKFTAVVNTEQRQDITVPRNSHVLKQHQRPGISYVQEDQVSHSYQLSSTNNQPEKHQSYLIVKKIAESAGRSNQSAGGEAEDQNRSSVFNYQLQPTTNCSSAIQTGFQSLVTPLFFERNVRKKVRNTLPLRRVTVSKLSNSLVPVSNDYQLDRATLNGRKPWAKLTRGKLCVNQSVRSAASTFYSEVESGGNEQLEKRPGSVGSTDEATESTNIDGRVKCKSGPGSVVHTLLSGNNKPYTVTRRTRVFGPDYPLLRQQLSRSERQLESLKQSDGKPATVQLQRRALTRFFEHVKLEEAHISAPLRTKLAHKDEVGDDEIVREGSSSGGSSSNSKQQYDDGSAIAEAPLLISDSPLLCELDEDVRTTWKNCDDNKTTNKSPVRGHVLSTNSTRVSNLWPVRHNSFLEDFNERFNKLFENRDEYSRTNEVSVPDDKADTERQDLPSGRRSRSNSTSSNNSSSNSNSSNSNSSSSSSSSSGHSDTPEQAMNANEFSDEYDILAIGLDPPREELERDELATASEADRSDAATG